MIISPAWVVIPGPGHVDCTMSAIRGAILAGLAMLAAGILPEPWHVRFELADGVQVSGVMTAWDEHGFDGSFGRRLWEELIARDVWRLYLRVMDPDDANQWVDLGRVLLPLADGGQWAQRAFRRAERLDPSVAGRVEAARRAAAEEIERRERLAKALEEHRLRTRTPEADDWPADPWPVLDAGERLEAIGALKAEADEMLRRAAAPARPIETDHFLVYADAAPIDAARLATRLESGYRWLAGIVGVDAEFDLFWGKAVVLYFSDQDRFRMVEADAFGQLVSRSVRAICHPVGPKVFINAWGDPASDEFGLALSRALVHGFMHRYRTPTRPPPWANEGLAEYVAWQSAEESGMTEGRRRGLEFVRAGGDVNAILDMTYDDGWPGPQGVGADVGALLIGLMIEQSPDAFRAWLGAVKTGKPCDSALAEDFTVPRPRLLDLFAQYYAVNE